MAHAAAVGMMAHEVKCLELSEEKATTIQELAQGKLILLGAYAQRGAPPA